MTDAPETAPVSAPEPVSTPTVTPESFSVPEAYAEKSWAQNIKSHDDLYNQFDNLQGMIGKKSVPGADASDEQLQEFYTQLRPEEAGGYDLSLPEGVEADQSGDAVQAEIEAVKGIFHKHGLSQKQAQGAYADYIAMQIEARPTEEQQDAAYAETMKAKYGEHAIAAEKVAAQYLVGSDATFKETFKELSPEAMSNVIEGINKIHNKFTKEDTSPEGGQPAPASSMDDKIAESNKLRMELKNGSPFDAGHKESRAKLAALDEEIKKLHK